MERAFKGVWIPAEIWLADDLTVTDKVIYAEIDSFCNRYQSCFASNKHFAKLARISENRVSHIIAGLVDKGYVKRQVIYAEDGKTIVQRLLSTTRGYCYPQQGGIVADNNRGIVADNKDNNTILNNPIEDNISKPVVTIFDTDGILDTDGMTHGIPHDIPHGTPKSKNVFDSVENTSLREALADFADMRKKIRKPLTERAKVLALKKLQSLSSDVSEQVKIVEQSILNGWQSFYELKGGNNGYGTQGNRRQNISRQNNPRFRSVEECERVFGAGEGTTVDVPFT